MEEEMIGIIAACSVCGFIGIIIAIIIGCYCAKRIEKKRQASKKAQTKEWVNGISPLAASESGFSLGPNKLSSYQPKILGKSISQEQLIRESSVSKGGKTTIDVPSRETRRIRRFSSSSDIRREEIEGKTISVVQVKSRNENGHAQYVYGHHSYQNGDYVVPGYMVGGHIYPENPSQRRVQQGQIVVGHHVTATGGQLVKGHRSHANESRQYVTTQNDGAAIITVKQDTPQLVQGHRSLHTDAVEALEASTRHQTYVTETIQQSVSEQGRVAVDEYPLPRGLITPVDHYVDDDPRSSSGVVTTVVEAVSVSPVTTTTVVTEETLVASASVPSTQVIEEVETIETFPSQAVSNIITGQSSHEEHQNHASSAHVIRRHHHDEHVKLPRWMTGDIEENQMRTMDFDDEERMQTVDFATDADDVGNFGEVKVVNTGVIEGSGEVSTIVTNRNTAADEEYTIMDYVDPEPQHRQSVLAATAFFESAASTSNDTTEHSMSGGAFTTTTTTQVIKSTRQVVDESAERIPPASTSTPRVPMVSQEESTTTFIVGAGGRMVEEVDSHRQRTMHDGSVEFLPPPPPAFTSADVQL